MDNMLAAAMLDRPWEGPLAEIAVAAGGHSACLWRSCNGRPFYLGSASFASAMRNVRKISDRPYKESCLPQPLLTDGFVTGAGPEIRDQLRHDAFQDILLKNDFSSSASCFLLGPEDSRGLRLFIWRGKTDDPFSQADLDALQPIAEPCRLAALFSKNRLEQLAVRETFAFEKRGEAVFRLDSTGKVKAMNAAAEASVAREDVLIVHGRLLSSHASERARIERAVRAVVNASYEPSAIPLSGRSTTKKCQLVLLPIIGEAIDVFDATRAVAILLDLNRPGVIQATATQILRTSFSLTERETGVAIMIAQGRSPAAIASTFGIGEGTARNHLKSSYASGTGLPHRTSKLNQSVYANWHRRFTRRWHPAKY